MDNVKMWMSASSNSITSVDSEAAIVLASNEYENRFYFGSLGLYEKEVGVKRIAETGEEITLKALEDMIEIIKSSPKYQLKKQQDCENNQNYAEKSKKLHKIMKRLEYSGWDEIHHVACCPLCGTSINDRNHSSDCELGNLIKGE